MSGVKTRAEEEKKREVEVEVDEREFLSFLLLLLLSLLLNAHRSFRFFLSSPTNKTDPHLHQQVEARRVHRRRDRDHADVPVSSIFAVLKKDGKKEKKRNPTFSTDLSHLSLPPFFSQPQTIPTKRPPGASSPRSPTRPTRPSTPSSTAPARATTSSSRRSSTSSLARTRAGSKSPTSSTRARCPRAEATSATSRPVC